MYRNREQEFRSFFIHDKSLKFVYCNDIAGLLNSLKPGIYKPEEWRLFMDSSIRSLKVLRWYCSITQMYWPVPIAHSTFLKESYDNIKIVLEKIKYSEHQWRICGDLKIICIVLSMQSGNIKYLYFLCLFDSRDRQNHYKKKEWTQRKSLKPGSANVIKEPLVEERKILLPSLHLKLGLMKQYVRALNKTGDCFQYIAKKMPKLIPSGKLVYSMVRRFGRCLMMRILLHIWRMLRKLHELVSARSVKTSWGTKKSWLWEIGE